MSLSSPYLSASTALKRRYEMYFFYIDESGNRDVKKDEPYVLAAVGMHESQWHDFNKHLMGMKTNIARKYDSDIGQDQLEVKANLLTKPKQRNQDPFFKHLTNDELHYISKVYFQQLERSEMVIIASVIDKEKLHNEMAAAEMHTKAYELLLERIQNFMGYEYRRHHKHDRQHAMIIMDNTEARTSRKTALMHARLLHAGNRNVRFQNIIEYPFFVSSEFSNGVQLADLVAYTIYHCFRYNKPDYEFLSKILPFISKHKDGFGKLTGIKVWPSRSAFKKTLNTIQSRVTETRDGK